MPLTPDRSIQATEYSDESLYEDFGLPDPTVAGSIRFRNGAFRQADALGVYNPRTPWAGLLDGVQREIAGTWYKVVTGTVAPSQVAWYSDAAKTKLVCMVSYSYSPTNVVLPITVVYRLYNADNTLRATCTDSITYSGAFEVARTRTFS